VSYAAENNSFFRRVLKVTQNGQQFQQNPWKPS